MQGTLKLDGVVVSTDLDQEASRSAALRAARDAGRWPFAVAIALANPELEAWAITGFVPETEAEKAALDDLRTRLGFDPTVQPERLVSTVRNSERDAKAVLRSLIPKDDVERHRRSLERPVGKLLAGDSCGLADFVREVQGRVLPRFTAP